MLSLYKMVLFYSVEEVQVQSILSKISTHWLNSGQKINSLLNVLESLLLFTLNLSNNNPSLIFRTSRLPFSFFNFFSIFTKKNKCK